MKSDKIKGDDTNVTTAPTWKSARDPKSGRIYYYNVNTRETTWSKPLELADEAEREQMIRKRAETKKFFDDMERNILRKIQNGKNSTDMTVAPLIDEFKYETKIDNFSSMNEVIKSKSLGGLRLVRTISSLDDEIIEMMKYQNAHEDGGSISRVRRRDPSGLTGIGYPLSLVKSTISLTLRNKIVSSHPLIRTTSHGLKRRNSTGTLYVGTTMSSQDNQATIECVCSVIRAHMIDAVKVGVICRPEFNTFKDHQESNTEDSNASSSTNSSMSVDLSNNDSSNSSSSGKFNKNFGSAMFSLLRKATSSNPVEEVAVVPSQEVIREFFLNIYKTTQMESECIIIALIYIERLIKVTKGKLSICKENWKSILFACLVLASKVWDDLSMWNVDFSHVMPSFDLKRVNELEMAMLEALDYIVKVTAGEYAKYYFHLRSMMARLGYHANEPTKISPLDMTGAKRLSISTEEYQANQMLEKPQRRRGVTLHEGASPATIKRLHSDGDFLSVNHALVGIEQVIHQDHVSADGIPPLSARQKTVNSP